MGDKARRAPDEDRQLMQQVERGDADARRVLARRLYARVLRLSRHLSRHDQEAEDLAQEAMMAVLDAAGSFRGEGRLESWADVIVVRTVRRKWQKLRRSRYLTGGQWFDAPSEAADPEAELRSSSGNERVRALLAQLPPDERLVLVLKLAEGHSAKEVASLTGQSLKDVQYAIKKGRASLRRLVSRDAQLRELFPGVAS